MRPCVNWVLRTLGTLSAWSMALTLFRVSFLPTMVVNHATLSYCSHSSSQHSYYRSFLLQPQQVSGPSALPAGDHKLPGLWPRLEFNFWCITRLATGTPALAKQHCEALHSGT